MTDLHIHRNQFVNGKL